MTREISNSDDVIDSRDVIERLKELDAWSECANCHEKCDLGPKAWVHRHSGDVECWTGDGSVASPSVLDEDESRELVALRALAAEGESLSDWQYGETLIRDSYFTEYAQELADDLGYTGQHDVTWPFTCIDWERAARELRMDYTALDFDGVTFWARS